MSAPTFMITMLVVLSQRAEVPKGGGWMPGSLSGRPGDAAYLVQSYSREIDSMSYLRDGY
jgi:hypothetical protein